MESTSKNAFQEVDFLACLQCFKNCLFYSYDDHLLRKLPSNFHFLKDLEMFFK